MPNALNWLVSNGKSVASVFAIADSLKQMIEKYPAPGASTNWEWLREELEGKPLHDNARKAVSADVLTQAKEEWGKLRKELNERLPEALQPLAQTTAQLAQGAGLEWPLFDLDKGAAEGPWKFGLQGKLDCTVTAYRPQSDSALGFDIPSGKVGLGLALHGDASIDVGAQGGFSWGSAEIGSKTGASAVLEAFATPQGDKPLALDLARLVSNMPVPGQLDSLFERSSGAPKQLEIRALHLKVDGTLTVSGAVSVGTSVVKSDAGKPMASLGIDVGLSANLQHERDYNLRVLLDGVKAKVELTCSRTAHQELGASLDAGLSIRGYANRLSAALQEALPTAQPLIEKLGTLTDIHGWLIELLPRELDGAAEEAAQILLQANSATSRKTQLVALLQQAFVDAYDEQGFDFKQLAPSRVKLEQAVVERVLALLGGKDIGGVVAKHLAPGVHRLFDKFDAQLKDEIGKIRKAIEAASGEALEKLVAPLADAADSLQAFVQKIQQKIDEVDAPLLAWLNAYEEKRASLLKSLAQVAGSQLKLSLGTTIATTHDEVSLLSATFVRYSFAADALYRGLWRGDLRGLPALLKRAEYDHAIESDYSGWLADTFVRQKTYRFSLDFFGLGGISATSSSLSRIAIKADLRSQRILACSTQATLDARLVSFGQEQDATLGLTLDAFATSGNGVPLTMSFSESGKQIDKDDVQMYFQSMAAAHLVDPTVRERAWRLLQGSAGQQGNKLSRALLRTQMQLSGDEWRTLLKVHSSDIHEAVCGVVWEVAQAAWAVEWAGDKLGDVVATLSEHHDLPELMTPTGLVAWCSRQYGLVKDDIAAAFPHTDALRRLRYDNVFLRIGALGTGFGKGLDELQKMAVTLATVAADPTAIERTDLRTQLEHGNKLLLKAWQSAATTGLPAVFTPLRFPWPTLAFYAALAIAVGRKRDRIGMLNLVSPSGKEEAALLLV